MKKPDILVFLSDQHTPYCMGGASIQADTPALDALRQDGTTFTEAYTSCPLCVPARMSMLSGQRPARTGIFTNEDTLPDVTPTFLHNLVEAGYETVLIGRMHFIGNDQRHGFTKRVAPDLTNISWARPSWMKDTFGVFTQTLGAKWCTDVVGGGESPIVHYDQMVADAAVNYLSQTHDKPQFIVVGTYAPHFPYVAPKDLFLKYQKTSKMPVTFGLNPGFLNPVLSSLQNLSVREETVLAARSAYRGMVENMDGHIGRVRAAFDRFTGERGTKKLFCYLSDHGDTLGDYNLFGKKTFFEKSAKIPLIFAGDGVQRNRTVNSPASIMDLGPTACEWTGAAPMAGCDGESLAAILKGENSDSNRVVCSEQVEKTADGKRVYACMIKQGEYKYITYHGYENQDMLFEPRSDPEEKRNLADEMPERLEYFREIKSKITNPEQCEREQEVHERRAQLFMAYEKAVGIDESERWKENPPEARVNPEICITGLVSEPGRNQVSAYFGGKDPDREGHENERRL